MGKGKEAGQIHGWICIRNIDERCCCRERKRGRDKREGIERWKKGTHNEA